MLTIDATLQATIDANKAKAQANDKLIASVNNKAARKEGKGLLTHLPSDTYILINMELVEEGDFTYELCTFRNGAGKDFKISLGTLLKPIFDQQGNDINECCTITVDSINEQFTFTVDPTKFGSRPFYNFAGERVLRTPTDKFYFYSESTGDTFKGKKTLVMNVVPAV